MRRIAFVFTVLAIAVLVAGCGPRPEPLTLEPGQASKLGDFRWSLASVLKTDEVGPVEKRTRAKGAFLIAGLEVRNQVKKKIRLEPDVLVLEDSRGKTYTPDRDLTSAYIGQTRSPRFRSIYNAEFLPEEKLIIYAVFDIDPNLTGLKISINGDKLGAERDLVLKLGF